MSIFFQTVSSSAYQFIEIAKKSYQHTIVGLIVEAPFIYLNHYKRIAEKVENLFFLAMNFFAATYLINLTPGPSIISGCAGFFFPHKYEKIIIPALNDLKNSPPKELDKRIAFCFASCILCAFVIPYSWIIISSYLCCTVGYSLRKLIDNVNEKP
jgi:hypothetical protein